MNERKLTFIYEELANDKCYIDQSSGRIYIANPDYPLKYYDTKTGTMVTCSISLEKIGGEE